MTALHRRIGASARPRRRSLAVLVLLALLVITMALSLSLGARDVPFGDVLDALLGREGAYSHQDSRYVVRGLRLPRSLVGLSMGAALAVAGALVQSLTRNPLADTGILGVDAGAAFAVTLGVAVLGVSGVAQYAWCAFAGATVTTVAVYLVGGRLGADPMRLVLGGLALGAVISGVTGILTLTDQETFSATREWLIGSMENRTTAHLLPSLPYLLVGLVIALLVTGSLNALALGDDLAASHGVHVIRVRVLVVVAITLLAGSATAVCGPIGFVGLMVPHVVRWVVGPDQRWVVALSAPAGAVLLLAADTLGRVVISPGEIPVGVVTAFVGAPVLILLVRMRRRVSSL